MFIAVATFQTVSATDVTNSIVVSNLKYSGLPNNQTGSLETMLVDFNFEGEWDASSLGASIQPGDFFTVPFNSKDSKIVLNNGSYALLNIDGTQLGTLSTSRNTGLLTFTFSNDIAGLENVRGTFKVKASARVSRGENHFTFPDGSQHTVNYTEGSSWSREPVINGENIYKSVEKYIQASGAPPELIQKLLAGEISIGEYKAALAQYSTTSMLWKVRINRSGGDYGTSNVTIRDSLNLTNGVVLPYKEDSFELNEVIYSGTTPTVVKRIKITTDEAEFISSAEDTALLILKDGKTAFELNLGNNVGTKSYELTYKTDVPEGGYSISNGITLYKNQRAMLTHRSITTGDQTTENTSTTTNASHSEQAVGGTITGDLRARIRITKYDAEDAAVLLAGASFKIAKTSDPSAVIQTLTTNKKGVALSNKLEPGEYFVTETTSPMGYRIDSISKKVIVSETGLTYLSVANTKGETDTPPATTEVSGTKTWVDNENQDGKRPEKLVVKLFKTVGGQTTEVETKEITSQNDWKYSFTNLPQFENGQAINYTIDEDVPDGYTKTVEGYHLTNTYEVEKTSIAVNKVWEDTNNQDGKRPEQVSVQLYADGQAVEGKLLMLNEVNNWRGSFDGLNKYKAGKVIAYTLQEVAVPAGYQSRTTGDMVNGFTITNSYSPATTEVSGTKTWVDNEDQDGKRPEKLVVKLFKTVGGQTTEVETKEITSQNDWKYSFTNLPQFENGQVINYTIDEDVPDGYTKTVEGYHLTNTYSPEVTEVSGTKNWDDANNQDGKRPDSITVHLLANGQKVASKTVTAADNWSYHFGNLAKYTAGQLVTYAIVEEAVSSYQARVDGYDLTNSYSPEMIDITVHKNWEDGDNQDGKRPSSITVHLLANGERVDSQMLQPDAIGNWSIRFTNKPKYANGQAIRYTVEEVAVEEYSTKIEDFTITNSYTPKEISYQVTKKWADKGNQDGKRPNSITVQLYKSVAGGEPVAVIGKTLTLTAADQTNADKWIGSFTKLPQFEKGQEITYSVREDEATLAILAEIGYLAKVEGQEIVNSRSPEMIRLSGSKVWDDANDQDGKRPASIVLVVKDGQGTEVERITVTPDETGRWSFESKDLPKYAAGKEVSYSVEELVTAEYTASITATDNKYTITNSYTPKKISIKGSKIWNDANNKDGIRPSSITVHLFANGVDTGKTATVSEATGWNYSFEELDQYQNGQSIQYTVQEDEVSGYTTQIEGTLIINSHVPKELTPVPKEQLTDSKNPPIEDKSGKSKPKKSLPATNSNMSLGLIALGLMLLVELGIYVMKRQK
ncbi:Cna B-type domain-containing protein [Streptococcus acidominimus]|uniref:Cna B-type domain-containing protein n=1 Tax=Streptococcus acidominimus TaxID=1326 RepID=UPI0009F99C8A|nr:Cna B-type domain-containing protein [Streptococcus acidominimus]